MTLTIRQATVNDAAVILKFIKSLAQYEKLSHEVVATEENLKNSLFGKRAYAEVLLGHEGDTPVAFALFFHNYSTFLAKPGIHLEDLYVNEEHRGRGYGKAMLSRLAQIAIERDCGRLEWNVLDWNTPAIDFYKRLGAGAMEEWTTFRLGGQALLNMAIGSSS